MSKILRIDEMLDVAREALSEGEYKWFESMMCDAGSHLAWRLAQKLNVTLFDQCSMGDGGIMASFRTGPKGEQPEVLGNEDADGEWD